MERSNTGVTVILLLSVALGPVALGYLIARWMPAIWSFSPSLWGWIFLVGWFMVGGQLGIKGYGLAGLMAGILSPVLWAGVYIQQSYLAPATQRACSLLSCGGQLYPMVAVAPATRTIFFVGVTDLDSRVAMLVAYIMVMGVFAAGFLSGHGSPSGLDRK